MSRKTILIAAIGILLIGAVAFLQLGKSVAQGGTAGPVKTLTIASIAYPHEGQQRFQGQTAIIQQQGWLKQQLAKRGIALVWFPVPTAVGGPLINEGFAAKRVDFASYGDFPAIIAVSGGVDLRLIVPSGRGLNAYLIVRNGLNANNIADLRGKRIALHRGRPWELPFAKLVQANGFSLKDFRLLNINPPASHAALASGDIDAAILLSDAYLLQEKGIGKIIWSTKQAPADWKVRAELFGRGDFVDAHPDIAGLVAEAYVRAAHWSSLPRNRDRVNEISARAESPLSVIQAEQNEPRVRWQDRFSPLYDDFMVGHYREVSDYVFRQGLVRTKVDVDRLLEPRFATESLRRLRLDDYWKSEPRQTALAPAAGAHGS